MTRSPYEIRVAGALGAAAREAFAELAVDVEPTATVPSGELDQSGCTPCWTGSGRWAWNCSTSGPTSPPGWRKETDPGRSTPNG